MATQAEEVAKIAAERLFEAARDGDVAAVDALLWPRPPRSCTNSILTKMSLDFLER